MKPLKDSAKVDFFEYESVLRIDLDEVTFILIDRDKRLNKCLCFYLPSHCSSGTFSNKYLIGWDDLLLSNSSIAMMEKTEIHIIDLERRK